VIRFRIFITVAFAFVLSGCDSIGGDSEAYAVAEINGDSWTSHTIARVNEFNSNSIDVEMVVVNAIAASRDALVLVDLPRSTGRFKIEKFPVNSQSEDDPFIYFESEVANSNDVPKQFILDNTADNYVDISTYKDGDVMEADFHMTLISLRPAQTEVDTLVFTEGFFSVLL